jgi:hypothetical protein
MHPPLICLHCVVLNKHRDNFGGYAVVYLVRHCASSRNVASSSPDEVIELFSVYLILQPLTEMSTWSKEKKMFLSVSRLSRQCGILNISQPYRAPRPGTGTALLCFYFTRTLHFFKYTRTKQPVQLKGIIRGSKWVACTMVHAQVLWLGVGWGLSRAQKQAF